MNSSKDKVNSKLLNRMYCCLFAFLLLSSVSSLCSQAAAASQNVTLTLSYSTPDNYMPYIYLLNVTASAPITSPVKLYWTIDGNGPFENTTQMVNGFYERDFGCSNPGNWTLWLVWAGDEQYSYSQSNAISVVGDPGGQPFEVTSTDYTMYAVIVAIVAVVAIGLSFAYVRSKSKKK